MKKKIPLICILLLMFMVIPTIAKNIPFTIDGAQFQYDDSRNLWELYYSFPDTALRYIRNGDTKKYIGSLHIIIQINSVSSGTIVKKEWIVDNNSDSEIRDHKRNLIGQKSFILSHGQYTVDVEISDINDTTSHAKTTLQLVIRTFMKSSIAISDIELASQISSQSSIKENNSNPAFFKNSLFVVPNPIHEFIGNAPTLAVYSEIYNAKTFARDSIRVEYKILDGAKREQFTAQFFRVAMTDELVETILLPLDGLSSGVYFLQLSVHSTRNSTDKATALKKFYVLNPEMPVELAPTLSEDELFHISEFATLADERVEEEFIKAKVLASQAEVQLFESLSENDAKQKFLYRFWKVRDPKPETPENEKLDEFRKTIAFANTYYSNILIKEGWRTDAGRILLKYGFPTQVDRHANESGRNPYEVWYYDGIQGGLQFQFVDIKGFGNFIQVNSNAMGESRNDLWFDQYVTKFDSQTGETGTNQR